MNRFSSVIRLTRYLPFMAAAGLAAATAAYAQVPVDDAGNPLTPIDSYDPTENVGEETVSPLTPAELETLVGPIALYPDDLLAIVLPASTYPLEIVQAARFLEQYKIDSSLTPNEEWDESVTALLNYPEVIELLNDDIDWTWKLGEAVIRQQQDVIATIESFRDRAYAAGNLRSDEYQNVTEDDGVIEIVPIEEDIIYVPYYEPERVLVSQVRPVYHYYPRAYPVYYYPYPYGYSFSSGYFWGVTTAFRIGWATNCLRVQHPSYWGHPYYGRSYYAQNYRSPSINVYNATYVSHGTRQPDNRLQFGDYWQPRDKHGARPDNYRSSTRSYRTTNVDAGNYVGRNSNHLVSPQRNARQSTKPARTIDRTAATREHIATTRNDEVRHAERSITRAPALPHSANQQRRVALAEPVQRQAPASSVRRDTPAAAHTARPAPDRSTASSGPAQKSQRVSARTGDRSQTRQNARRRQHRN